MFKFKIDKDAIDKLCKILKSNNLSEIEIKDGSKSIKISKQSIQMPSIVNPSYSLSSESTSQKKSKEKIEGRHTKLVKDTVKAPMLGTLYHASSPKADPFIKIGSKVKVGDIIFIIEAMKTMNHVPSPQDGVVKEIIVEDGQHVEFGQTIATLD